MAFVFYLFYCFIYLTREGFLDIDCCVLVNVCISNNEVNVIHVLSNEENLEMCLCMWLIQYLFIYDRHSLRETDYNYIVITCARRFHPYQPLNQLID